MVRGKGEGKRIVPTCFAVLSSLSANILTSVQGKTYITFHVWDHEGLVRALKKSSEPFNVNSEDTLDNATAMYLLDILDENFVDTMGPDDLLFYAIAREMCKWLPSALKSFPGVDTIPIIDPTSPVVKFLERFHRAKVYTIEVNED